MKIIVLKENFKRGLSAVERNVGTGTVLPVLKNVLIKTEKGKIKICATNLEVGSTAWVSGKIVDEGGITVPSIILRAVLDNIDSVKLEIESDDNKLFLKGEKSENVIQGIKDSDFPIIPPIQSENFLEIKAADLKKSLNQAISGSSGNARRPELNSVLFWLKNKKLKLVSTDAFRLAEKTIKPENFKTNLEEIRVSVPFKTIQEVLRMTDDGGKIKIYFENHQISFIGEEWEIISRLITGEFPDHESIIPENSQTSVFCEKNDLISAVKLASVFSGKMNDIRIEAEAGNKIKISGRENSIGENHSEINAEISGENQNLVLNSHYFLDGLKVFEDDEINIGLNGEIKAVILKSIKDESFLYIMMPIKSGS